MRENLGEMGGKESLIPIHQRGVRNGSFMIYNTMFISDAITSPNHTTKSQIIL